MALAINVINGHGSSNKMHCQLHPKKTKVKQYDSLMYQLKEFYPPPFITSKILCFSFKSGCVLRVENGKMHCQL